MVSAPGRQCHPLKKSQVYDAAATGSLPLGSSWTVEQMLDPDIFVAFLGRVHEPL